MPAPSAAGALPAEPLAETLHWLRLTGTLYCRAEMTAPWGVEVPTMEGSMTFQIVTAKGCWMEVEGEPPRWLAPGSLSLLPHGTAHRMRSDLETSCISLADLPVESISDRYERVEYGGGGDRTLITYGVVRLEHVAGQRLIPHLPVMLQFDAWSDDESQWLHSTLQLITREASTLRPGGDTVITRLADILVIQAIRAWLDTTSETQRGWLAALRDPHVGPALALIHRHPGRAWSVATLAKTVGMSRSAFSARFSALVGDSAMRYLTQWRMDSARQELASTDVPLTEVASRLGYRSEAAFCRAFKREYGISPGVGRHRDRGGDPGQR